MSDRPRVSKWVLAMARWALLFGIIGVGAILSAWFHADRSPAQGEDALLLIGTAFVALAFVLAPFVRNAFGLPTFSQRKSRAVHKTTLDELREGTPSEPADEVSAPHVPTVTQLTMTARVVIGLYVVFAIVLIAALVTM